MFEKIEKIGEKQWGAFLLCAFPFFIIMFPLLFGMSVFAGMDTRQYPLFYFYKASIVQGESFLWNPLNYSGFPFFVSISGGFLSPVIYILFKFLPYIEVYHWVIFFSISFASFFTFIFLKKIGVNIWGGMIAGFIFGFSQWVWLADFVIMVLMPILPFAFMALLEIYRGKKWYIFFLGTAIAYGILTGIFQYVLEIIFALGIFALFLLFFDENYDTFLFGNWRKNKKIVIGFLSAVILGIALSLHQIVPTLMYVPFSAGRGDFSHWEAVTGGIQLGDIPKIFSPYFDAWFLASSYERLYIGIFPLVFLFFSFWFKKSRFILFFYSLFFISLFLSLNNSWLFWLLHHVPPFNLTHLSFRWMFVGWFAMAVIVGWAVDRFWAGEELRWLKKNVLILGSLFWALAISSFFVFIFSIFLQDSFLRYFKEYFRLNLYSKTTGLPLEHYYNYIDRLYFNTRALVDITRPDFFIPLIFIGMAWYLLRLYRDCKIGRILLVKIVVATTVCNFFFVWVVYAWSVNRKIFYEKPMIAEFIEGRNQEGRALTFLKKYTDFQFIQVPAAGKYISPAEATKFNLEMLFANTNILSGVESAEIYEPLMSRRMARVIALTGSDLVWFGERLASIPGSPAEKAKILETRKNILNFTGVRYIISAYPFAQNVFPKIFETTILPPYNVNLGVYENSSARPRFYFADSVEVVPENEQAAFVKLKTIPEEGLGVFIECDFSNIGCFREHPMLLKNVDGQGELEIQTKKNTISILKTKSETPQFLVFSENNLPGWKAHIDGIQTPIYTTGSVYIGVAVPSGEHEVKFEFTYKTIVEEFIKRFFGFKI